MTKEENVDPELVEDYDEDDQDDIEPVELPAFNPNQFELPDDFEYEEDGDEDGCYE